MQQLEYPIKGINNNQNLKNEIKKLKKAQKK
jgi:hypothetical protein